jgi:prepilin-type N-terminal cleavage/methylation domain-containing protein
MVNESVNKETRTAGNAAGFSLIEMMVTMTITLLILGLAFSLLAQSMNRKSREETQASILADANLALSRLSREVMNAGFGLTSNGIVPGDSGTNKIRVRANLNALLKQTTSTTVNDPNEDLVFTLVANPNGLSSLVRTDIGLGQSSVLATRIDNADIDNDGVGDGLVFTYFNTAGNVVAPASATRVDIAMRVTLPQVGQPGSPGFQPSVTRVLRSSVVLRNADLSGY